MHLVDIFEILLEKLFLGGAFTKVIILMTPGLETYQPADKVAQSPKSLLICMSKIVGTFLLAKCYIDLFSVNDWNAIHQFLTVLRFVSSLVIFRGISVKSDTRVLVVSCSWTPWTLDLFWSFRWTMDGPNGP